MQLAMNSIDGPVVYSIGHSNHTIDHFLSLLRSADISAIADVRSSPYSRHLPQFNQGGLKQSLSSASIAYVFLGKELGGRPEERSMYRDGIADYEKMASLPRFRDGLARVVEGAKRYRIALMCSEHNPLDCHRCLLVSRWLVADGTHVVHILANGTMESHLDIEQRLLELANVSASDFFSPLDERLAMAYRDRSRKVAYAESMSEQGTL